MTDDDMDARSGIARQLTRRCNNCYRKLPGEVGCSVNRPGWNWATPNLGPFCDSCFGNLLLSETKEPQLDWQPIETAPKDGTHLLVCDASRAYTAFWGFGQNPPTVGHYFAQGWHLSVNHDGEHSEITPTHWMPLPSPPVARASRSETKEPQPKRDAVLQQLQLWLIECPTDKRFTLVRQQVEALVSEVPK